MFQKLKYTITNKGINPLVFLCAFCLIGSSLNAQKLKEAEKFLLKKRFTEAKTIINEILCDSLNYCKYEPYFVKGEIYLGEYQSKLNTDTSYSVTNIALLDTAMESYIIAQQLADSSSVPFNLLVGIQNCGIHYNNKGLIEYQKSNLDTALYFIEKAIEIDRTRSKVDTTKLYNCFAIAAKIPNLKKVNYYGNYLTDSLKVENENIFGTLIQLNHNNRNSEKAIAILERAIESNPKNENYQALRINFAINDTDLVKSIIELETLYKKDTANVYLANTLANLCLKIGESKKAVKYFKKVIELDSTNFKANFNLGSIHYNQAVDLNNSFENQESIAKIEQKEVDLLLSEALPYFRTAHNLKANDKDCMESLKLIYSKLPGYETELKEIEALLNN